MLGLPKSVGKGLVVQGRQWLWELKSRGWQGGGVRRNRLGGGNSKSKGLFN